MKRVWEDREWLLKVRKLLQHLEIDNELAKEVDELYMEIYGENKQDAFEFNFLEADVPKVDYEYLKQKELLHREDVMLLLGISNATLHRWTVKGIITKYGLEGKVFYKFSEIIDTLTELSNGGHL